MATGSSFYEAFGLVFQSDLPLPEASPRQDGCAADVSVRLGDVARPPGLTTIVDGVAAGPSAFWMDAAPVARYLVRDGCEIVVEPYPGGDPATLRAFLLGSAAGALLLQRGLLPLHASAVRLGDHVVACMGPSGAGKSTLALSLASRGGEVLCDDICAVHIAAGAAGGATMAPGLRSLKLWPPSLLVHRHVPEGLDLVLPGQDKRVLPVAASMPSGRLRLDLICLLQPDEAAAGMRPLHGAAAMQALVANTFRGQLVRPLGRSADHFRQCAALAGSVPMIALSRPRDGGAFAAWPDVIEEYLATAALPTSRGRGRRSIV